VVAKTTRSEFWGFLKDKYTTPQETTDRIMATSLVARWRYENTDVDFDKSYAQVRALLLKQSAQVHSYTLQQTLCAMGQAVLEESRTSPRSNSRRRRSTTSWLTSRRSASRTPARSSTLRTDRTA
jgi:urate oxidase